jgi:hypothetical protein
MGEGAEWGGGTSVYFASVVSSPTKGDAPTAVSPLMSR